MATLSPTTDAAVRVRGLVKRYGDLVAVDGIDFEARRGSCLGVLGPNGAGKTTTIEMLEGLKRPDAGTIEVLGRDWASGRREIQQRMGVQLQETDFQDKLKVFEMLRMFRAFYAEGAELDEVLETIGLTEKRDAFINDLSGGQRQRLAVGCALLNRPEILFLDEPTTGLDPQARRNFWDLVKKIQAHGTTVVLTTHYMDEAQVLCDEIAIMDAGKILSQGNPDALLRERYAGLIIELPVDDVKGDLAAIEHRIIDNPGIVEIVSTDVAATLSALSSEVSDLNHIKIRQANLEDLFLDLTGHSLRA